jgi:hypothetical protein
MRPTGLHAFCLHPAQQQQTTVGIIHFKECAVKSYLRPHVLALCLLAPASAFVAGIPATAAAQARPATGQAATPVIQALQVNADNALSPGSELQFTVEGTPRAQVRVGLDNNRVAVPLQESARGVYRGTYTVRRADQIDPSGVIRVSLTSGGRTAVTNFTYPSSFLEARAPSIQQPAAAALAIERFTAMAVDRIEPGTVLRYRLVGAPGGNASFAIPGVANRIEMRETRPGRYEGSYTVRRNDNLQALDSAVATLRSGNQVATADLDRLRVRDTDRAMGSAPLMPVSVPVQLLSPGNNAAVDGSQVIVQGRATPGSMVRVKVDAVAPAQGSRMSVAQAVMDQTVQADMNGNFSFSFGQPRVMPVPGTRYEVSAESLDGGQPSASRLVLFQRG